MSNVKEHVIQRMKERFDVDLLAKDYDLLNTTIKNITPLYLSRIYDNIDFRKIFFKEKDIVCIYDNKLGIVKTVLNPIFEGKNPDVGKSYIGTVLKEETFGYKILLDETGCIGVLHESVIKSKPKKGDKYLFKVISNKIDNKSKKRRIFLSIQL